MSRFFRSFIFGLIFFAAACSMEAAINKLSSAEDRAFAQRFVADVRRGDAEALAPQFDPELWVKSRDQLPMARALFPAGEGTTRLIGFHVSANLTNGQSTTSKQYVLVTTDGSHWTRTIVATLARDGPARVVEWNVNGFKAPPPELEMYESMERAAPWVQAGAVLFLLALVGLVWWLVRRSRKRAAR
jgi:hypothetical protein